MASQCKAIFADILINAEEALTPLGFVRKKTDLFLKWEGDYLKRLSLIYTKCPGVKEASVNVAAAAGFKSLTNFLKRCPDVFVGNPSIPTVMVTDIGYLRPPYSYRKWYFTPSSDYSRLTDEIVREIKDAAFPFFDRYSSMEEVLEALESGVSYNLGLDDVFFVAGIHYLKGRSERALEVTKASIEHFKKEYERYKDPRDLERLKVRERFLEYLKTH